LLAAWHGPFDFVLGAGAEDLICRLNRGPLFGRKVGVVVPNFHRIYQTLNHPSVLLVPSERPCSILDPAPLVQALESGGYDAVWLSNPNPITGKAFRRRDVDRLLSRFRRILFLVDEASVGQTEDPAAFSVISLSGSRPNLVVLRSFSKDFGMPGLRLGYACGNPEVLDFIRRGFSSYPVSGLSAWLGTRLIEQRELLDKIRLKAHEHKCEIVSLLSSAPLTRLGTSLTQILLLSYPGLRLWDLLKKRGILTLDLNGYPGVPDPDSIRMTVHSSDQSFHFLRAGLLEVLEEIRSLSDTDSPDPRRGRAGSGYMSTAP